MCHDLDLALLKPALRSSSLHPPLFLSDSLLPLAGAEEELLSALMMSAPRRRRLSAESQQLAFKVSASAQELEGGPDHGGRKGRKGGRGGKEEEGPFTRRYSGNPTNQHYLNS